MHPVAPRIRRSGGTSFRRRRIPLSCEEHPHQEPVCYRTRQKPRPPCDDQGTGRDRGIHPSFWRGMNDKYAATPASLPGNSSLGVNHVSNGA
jgi:hypothetical protein